MAQQLRTLATPPKDQSSIPSTHTAANVYTKLRGLCYPLLTSVDMSMMHIFTYRQTTIHIQFKSIKSQNKVLEENLSGFYLQF